MVHDPLVPQVSRVGRWCLVLTTGLLVFAAVAALFGMPLTDPVDAHPGAARKAPNALAAERALPPRVEDGRVLVPVRDAGFAAAVLDAANPALLHVVVPHGSRAVDCNLIQPVVHVVAQNAIGVRLVVSGYEYVPRTAARTGSGGTTCVTAGTASVPVLLAAPLGERHLFAGRSPSATTVADPGDLPRITELPDGYHQRTVEPVLTSGERLVASRIYRHGAARLIVRVGSRYDVVARGKQESEATVDGHYAIVTTHGETRCVTWNELSGRVRQVCSSSPDGPLYSDGLVSVARTLSGADA